VNATKERQAWCCLQAKLCDPCLCALYVPWCEKALYKYSSFLSFFLWFLGPARVHTPNGISIGSAVFTGLTTATDWQTDRQTDHATPLATIIRICVVVRCGLTMLCNIVATDGTNQSHNVSEIYNVHLYQSTNSVNAPQLNSTQLNDVDLRAPES